MGAVLGAGIRWAVVAAVPAGPFPWPTLLVNLAGCVVVGVLVGAPRSTVMFVGVGVAGGLTTFSTFAVEAAALFADADPVVGAVYVAASLAGGVLGVVAGRRIGPW